MTGLDALREEIIRRGGTDAMAKSKTAALVLEILSEGNVYSTAQVDLEKWERRLDKRERDLSEREQRLKKENAEQDKAWRRMHEEAKEEVEDKLNYIKAFCEGLSQCETPEARDAMRTAQVFVNTVNVDTKYDNTAFIVALASILTSGKINGVTELKKINKDFAKRVREDVDGIPWRVL